LKFEGFKPWREPGLETERTSADERRGAAGERPITSGQTNVLANHGYRIKSNESSSFARLSDLGSARPSTINPGSSFAVSTGFPEFRPIWRAKIKWHPLYWGVTSAKIELTSLDRLTFPSSRRLCSHNVKPVAQWMGSTQASHF
jgi:hypothetical protein